MTIPCLLLAIENDLPVAELTFVLCYFYESGILSPRGLSFLVILSLSNCQATQ